MFHFIRKTPVALAFLPLNWKDYDKVDKDTKTAQDFYLRRNDTESGKDRLYRMFSVDEFGSVSSELNSIYQSGFLGAFAGAVYGGFLHSRNAYFNFIDKNQATAFKSHLDAKKKLQDRVTLGFAKGAWMWGWRLCLFSTSYVAITTTISVYNGKSSIWEYLTAGVITGSTYKMSMGLRGMVAGGLVGGVFGTVAGGVSLLILKMTGKSMEEVRYWQYKWRIERDQAINESMKVQTVNDKDALLLHHNDRFGESNIDLSAIERKSVHTNSIGTSSGAVNPEIVKIEEKVK